MVCGKVDHNAHKLVPPPPAAMRRFRCDLETVMVNAPLTSTRLEWRRISIGWHHVQRLTLNNLDGMTGLAGLADRSGVDIRPTLLRVLTDLYIQKSTHTPHEDQHFAELALRLIEVVDDSTRAAVAARLKKHPGTPPGVLTRLAELSRGSADVPEHGGTDPVVTETSLDDDLGIFEPSAVNENASHAMPERPYTVDYIGQREAFFSANADERRLILANLVHVAEQDVALAQQTNIIRYLEQAALAGRAQEFTTLLQQGLGVSRALARRVVIDPLGHPFVVAGKALAMPTDVFQRILMSLNPDIGQSVERVFELSDLFLELPLPSTLHMVAIWRAADRLEARTSLHRRTHWDDATPVARRTAAQDPRRAIEGLSGRDAPRRENSRS
jgi:hypothetical protein